MVCSVLNFCEVLSEFTNAEVAVAGYKIALYKMVYALCSKCGMQCNNRFKTEE